MNLFQNQPVSIRLTVEDVHDGVGRPGGDGDGGVVEAAHVAVAAGVDKVAAGGAGVLVAEEAALLRGGSRPWVSKELPNLSISTVFYSSFLTLCCECSSSTRRRC